MFGQQSFYFKTIDSKDKDHNFDEFEITKKHTICILLSSIMFFLIKRHSMRC